MKKLNSTQTVVITVLVLLGLFVVVAPAVGFIWLEMVKPL